MRIHQNKPNWAEVVYSILGFLKINSQSYPNHHHHHHQHHPSSGLARYGGGNMLTPHFLVFASPRTPQLAQSLNHPAVTLGVYQNTSLEKLLVECPLAVIIKNPLTTVNKGDRSPHSWALVTWSCHLTSSTRHRSWV